MHQRADRTCRGDFPATGSHARRNRWRNPHHIRSVSEWFIHIFHDYSNSNIENTQLAITKIFTMTSSLPGYASHFGLSNIPFGIASSAQHSVPQHASRYEDNVIFLADLNQELGDIKDLPKDVFSKPTLNDFAALPRAVHQAVRERLQQLLKSSGIASTAIEPISAVTMHLPVQCSDFSDFSCSSDHVENASEAMTGNRSHPPAFFHQPVGYAGRCSSLDVSGTSQVRPLGQYWSGKPGNSEIVFGPSKRMDYELELGAIIGKPLPRRQRLLAKDAAEHIFGFVLVNDWSGKSSILNQMKHTQLKLDGSSRYPRLRDEPSWATKRQEPGHKRLSLGHHTRRTGGFPYNLSFSTGGRANTIIPSRLWQRGKRHQTAGACDRARSKGRQNSM